MTNVQVALNAASRYVERSTKDILIEAEAFLEWMNNKDKEMWKKIIKENNNGQT